MPEKMRVLGNKYIREEFQKHLYPTIQNFNQAHFQTFMDSWKTYANDMKNPEIMTYGRKLSPDELKAMSPSQKKAIGAFQDQYLKKL